MTVELKNKQTVSFRLLQKEDAEALYKYLNNLSAESRSRFGPHPYDWQTIENICNHLPGDTLRFIAVDREHQIIAYMLVKNGMFEADKSRYHQLNVFLDENVTGTYAPSVADAWQKAGAGTAMFKHIKTQLENTGCKYLVLWGGVQTLNIQAVNFYTKHGFKQIGSFWYDGKDNLDMFLEL